MRRWVKEERKMPGIYYDRKCHDNAMYLMNVIQTFSQDFDNLLDLSEEVTTRSRVEKRLRDVSTNRCKTLKSPATLPSLGLILRRPLATRMFSAASQEIN